MLWSHCQLAGRLRGQLRPLFLRSRLACPDTPSARPAIVTTQNRPDAARELCRPLDVILDGWRRKTTAFQSYRSKGIHHRQSCAMRLPAIRNLHPAGSWGKDSWNYRPGRGFPRSGWCVIGPRRVSDPSRWVPRRPSAAAPQGIRHHTRRTHRPQYRERSWLYRFSKSCASVRI